MPSTLMAVIAPAANPQLWFMVAVLVLAAVPWTIYEFTRAQRKINETGAVCHAGPVHPRPRSPHTHAPHSLFRRGHVCLLGNPSLCIRGNNLWRHHPQLAHTHHQIAMHLEYYTRPKLQIRIIRILWMVPVYAINSWLALGFKDAQPVLDAIRECYEAFVVYNFFEFLMAYLQDELGDIAAYYSTKHPVRVACLHATTHRAPGPAPLACRSFPPTLVQRHRVFLGVQERGACVRHHAPHHGARHPAHVVGRGLPGRVPQPHQRLPIRHARVQPVPGVVALLPGARMYHRCLRMVPSAQILMYMATKAELEPIRPLSKFLCIKMVIFASYWQGVLIGILVHLGIIHTGEWTTYSNPKDIGAGLQDFLICIEMFVAALAHAYAFPPRDYMDMNTWHGPGFTGNLRRMFDMRDVMDDTTLVANDLVSSTAQGITNVCRGVVSVTTKHHVAQAGRSTLQAARYTIVDKPRSMLGKMFTRGYAGAYGTWTTPPTRAGSSKRRLSRSHCHSRCCSLCWTTHRRRRMSSTPLVQQRHPLMCDVMRAPARYLFYPSNHIDKKEIIDCRLPQRNHGTQDSEECAIAPLLCVRALQVNGTSWTLTPRVSLAAYRFRPTILDATGIW